MATPLMGKKKDQNLPVVINGGLNISKIPSQIDDNQASDMLNLWNVDGTLNLRPAVIQKITQAHGKIVDVCPKDGSKLLLSRKTTNGVVQNESYGIYILTETAILSYDGNTISEVSYFWNDGSPFQPTDISQFSFKGCSLIRSVKYSVLAYGDIYTHIYEYGDDALLLGNGLFFVLGVRIINHGGTNNTPVICAQKSDSIGQSVIGGASIPAMPITVPTTYINLKPNGSGDKSQDRNILSPKVKVTFTTTATDTVYHLPENNIDSGSFTIDYDNLAGTVSTFIFFSSDTSITQNGITATLSRTNGTITFSSALVNASAANAANNLTMTYPKTVYFAPQMKKCNIASWFGGNYQGEISGNRLFVSGNPDEQTTVRWSEVNDPLYWPESNVYTVGTPSDPVTAFGKMFDIMAVFKKGSTCAISYDYQLAASSDTSGKFGTSYFPQKEVSSSIGCDIPDSVQIINSKLVWANTKGGVYTLESTTVKDERVVREISKNVRNLLLNCISSDAVSIDTGKYYILFTQGNAFAWDYNSTAFIDYSDTDKAQNRLAWYFWSIPITPSAAFLMGSDVWLVNSTDSSIYALDDDSFQDTAGWFSAYASTKLYNFNLPAFTKNVFLVNLNISNKDAVSIIVTSRNGNEEDESQEIFLDENDVETMHSENFSPDVSWSEFFGLKIERSDENNSYFKINEIVINYKIGGRA